MINFKLLEIFPIVKKNYLQYYVNVSIKKYLFDNTNYLKDNKIA